MGLAKVFNGGELGKYAINHLRIESLTDDAMTLDIFGAGWWRPFRPVGTELSSYDLTGGEHRQH